MMKTNKKGQIQCDLCKIWVDGTTTIKSVMTSPKWELELCILCRSDLYREIQYQITLEQMISLIDMDRTGGKKE